MEGRYIGTIFFNNIIIINDALLISICASSTASACFVNVAKGFNILSLFFYQVIPSGVFLEQINNGIWFQLL